MFNKGWEIEIDNITTKFTTSFGVLSLSQLNHKPDRGVWSIAQNVSHLILVNSSYFQIFDEVKRGKHFLPPSNSMAEAAANSLRMLRPYTSKERLKKANTWTIWQPPDEDFDSKLLVDFNGLQSAFKVHIAELQEFFSHPTYIKYPGETELVFRLEDCIDFLIEHENRHWVQSNEVMNNLD
ncbi:MAG: DinB family protein [Cyclobacteriaceae bacterium]|nr:DinB family protein [Cyclobacteriaceae bacterium]